MNVRSSGELYNSDYVNDYQTAKDIDDQRVSSAPIFLGLLYVHSFHSSDKILLLKNLMEIFVVKMTISFIGDSRLEATL